MTTSRRGFLAGTTAGLAAAGSAAAAGGQSRRTPVRKIAAEEAFATPELVKA